MAKSLNRPLNNDLKRLTRNCSLLFLVENSGSRLPPRRFNSESSESNVEKSRNDRENEDWDVHDKYKSNRERNYGKHNAPHFDADHARRFYERNERR